MKQGWEIKKLAEIGKVYNGNSINEKVKKDNYSDLEDGFPYIATKDVSYESEIDYDNGIKIPFTEKLSYKTAPKNTVLICAEGGSAGRKIGFTNQEVCFGNKLFALAANKNVESRYVFYYYFSAAFQKQFAVELAGIIGGVSMNKFKDIEIPLPPFPEQQLIVALLDEAFAAIAKAKANAEQNLKNTKELFESYLKGVFENKGEGWESKELMDVCEQITDGSHFSPKSSGEEEYPYITVRDIDEDIIDFENCKFICKKDYQSLLKNGCKPNNGDLLFSKDGTVGKVSLVDFEKDFVVLSSLAIIRPKAKIITSTILKYILKNPQFLQTAIGMKTGVAIRRIILKNLKLIKISFPKSLKEQQAIAQKLDSLSAETKRLETIYQTKINDLEELKKSVLQKAFSGELKTAKSLAI